MSSPRVPADRSDAAASHVLPLTRTATPGVRLATLVADVIRAVAADRPQGLPAVRIESDVDASVAVAVHATSIRRLLESLVRTAAASAARRDPDSDVPPLREVLLTAVDTGHAIEIEVADSGPPHGISADDVATATRVGAALDVTTCAEGGSAVTLRLPDRRALVRAA